MTASFDRHDNNGTSEYYDDELAMEINEANEWGNPYDGGFIYEGDESIYEGLTILHNPYIDSYGSVAAIPFE